jgi:hypothetical protein
LLYQAHGWRKSWILQTSFGRRCAAHQIKRIAVEKIRFPSYQ